MRRAAKVDTNQGAIVDVLRDIGASVLLLHQVGGGCPDILVGYRGRTWGPYEIKFGRGSLTPDEDAWWGEWRGGGAIVYDVDEILADMGVLAE